MERDIVELLRRQPYLRAREQVLLARLRSIQFSPVKKDDIIDEITFSPGRNDGSQHVPSQGSRTEYAALNLDRLEEEEQQRRQEDAVRWQKELSQVRYTLSILEGALLVLTPEERILVEKYYFEGGSLEAISQVPLKDVIRSKSTLKRMLKNVQKKIEEVIDHEEKERPYLL